MALALLAVTALGAFAVMMRSASWYVEPIIAAGLRMEQALANAGKVKASPSWEGRRRLSGPAGAFLFVQLVHLRRYRRQMLSHAAVIGAFAVFIADVLRINPLLSLVPAIGLSLATRLPTRASQPWRDEWFARSPSSLHGIILTAQAPPIALPVLETTVSWVPAAFTWTNGTLSYLLVGTAGLLLMLLLSSSLNFALIVQLGQPTISFLVRLGLPVVLACLGTFVWFASGRSPVILGGYMAAFSALALAVFFEFSVKSADR